MKKLLLIFLFPVLSFSQTLQVQSPIRFLALGDSYTIGQSVPAAQRWPAQLKDSLALRGIITDTMRIIATTGWRTDNLLNAITNQHLQQQHYNLVSLLIGVNNQYQGTPFSQYVNEFPQLLDSAIRYAGGDTSHVFVVSIPDYAYTPYGQSTGNQAQISQELDQYNAFNKQVADSFHVRYFDITPISRMGLAQPNLVAPDGLHPSGIQYAQWVKLMLQYIDGNITTAVSQKEEEKLLTIFPNPTSNQLTVFCPVKGTKAMAIYDNMGKLVYSQETDQDRADILLNNLSRGIYILRVVTNSGQITRKIIAE